TRQNLLIKAVAISSFAIFAVVSLFGILGQVAAGRSFPELDPRATTNGFLSALDAPNPGYLVETALTLYPPGKSLMYVAPDKDPFSMQVFFTIAYLAYPRPMSAVLCDERGKPPANIIYRTPQSDEIGGVVFYVTDPGRLTSVGGRITPKLFIAPHKGVAP